MRLRSKLVAFGCALAFVASIGVVLFVNFQPDPGLVHRDLGVIAALWFAVFFLPPFIVGLRTNANGAVYGLVVGLVPLIIAFLFRYSGPLFVAVFFYALAPLGGFLGQSLSRPRSAG